MNNSNGVNKRTLLKLHHQSFIVDGHADTFGRIPIPLQDFFQHTRPTQPGKIASSHIDYHRLKDGGLNLQFMAIYTPPKFTGSSASSYALRMLFEMLHTVRQSNGKIILIKSVNDLNQVIKQNYQPLQDTPLNPLLIEGTSLSKKSPLIRGGRGCVSHIPQSSSLGFLISIEGGNPLNSNLSLLKVFYDLGVRALGLTHSPHNDLGDGVSVKKPQGLTAFGKEVVKEMNRLGMLIDIAHLSKPGFNDVLSLTKGPIISSHTGVRTLRNLRRNLDDEQIKEIASRKGVMGIFYIPKYIKKIPTKVGITHPYPSQEGIPPKVPSNKRGFRGVFYPLRGETQDACPVRDTSLYCKKFTGEKDSATVKDVVDHIQYIADKFGVDYVGLGSDFDGYGGITYGLEDVTYLPNITAELVHRGFNQKEIKKILGGNFVRVIKSIL